MNWRDEGLVLGVRRHGENAAIVTLFTRENGKHAGLVRGATSQRLRAALQPGSRVQAGWRARLADHLGSFTIELLESGAGPLLDHPGRLSALSTACLLVDVGFPEREPHPPFYSSLRRLIAGLAESDWATIYARWELSLLTELGFGLDLRCCAATGEMTDLVYVSPKSGRAVSREAGEPYRDRLLPLPGFLTGGSQVAAPSTLDLHAVQEALTLTGWFLNHHVFAPHSRKLPDSRLRLCDWLSRQASR